MTRFRPRQGPPGNMRRVQLDLRLLARLMREFLLKNEDNEVVPIYIIRPDGLGVVKVLEKWEGHRVYASAWYHRDNVRSDLRLHELVRMQAHRRPIPWQKGPRAQQEEIERIDPSVETRVLLMPLAIMTGIFFFFLAILLFFYKNWAEFFKYFLMVKKGWWRYLSWENKFN